MRQKTSTSLPPSPSLSPTLLPKKKATIFLMNTHIFDDELALSSPNPVPSPSPINVLLSSLFPATFESGKSTIKPIKKTEYFQTPRHSTPPHAHHPRLNSTPATYPKHHTQTPTLNAHTHSRTHHTHAHTTHDSNRSVVEVRYWLVLAVIGNTELEFDPGEHATPAHNHDVFKHTTRSICTALNLASKLTFPVHLLSRPCSCTEVRCWPKNFGPKNNRKVPRIHACSSIIERSNIDEPDKRT